MFQFSFCYFDFSQYAAIPEPDEPPSTLMTQGIIAKKVGMSRIFLEGGEVVPVTYLQVEPNVIVQTKTVDKDGYNAVVLGAGAKQWTSRKGKENTRYAVMKEWHTDDIASLEKGKEVTCESLPVDTKVTVVGISKGKGFQGVMKRHNFAGGPKTHGSHFHRRPGSVGMCEFPGRVMKGKKMPGRMGSDTITVKNRSIVFADVSKNLIAVKGPVPGANGSNVFLTVES